MGEWAYGDWQARPRTVTLRNARGVLALFECVRMLSPRCRAGTTALGDARAEATRLATLRRGGRRVAPQSPEPPPIQPPVRMWTGAQGVIATEVGPVIVDLRPGEMLRLVKGIGQREGCYRFTGRAMGSTFGARGAWFKANEDPQRWCAAVIADMRTLAGVDKNRANQKPCQLSPRFEKS